MFLEVPNAHVWHNICQSAIQDRLLEIVYNAFSAARIDKLRDGGAEDPNISYFSLLSSKTKMCYFDSVFVSSIFTNDDVSFSSIAFTFMLIKSKQGPVTLYFYFIFI